MSIKEALRTWRVTCHDGPVEVKAHKYDIDANGNLVFTIIRPDGTQQTTLAVVQGYWYSFSLDDDQPGTD
jgi:hypothetical protein